MVRQILEETNAKKYYLYYRAEETDAEQIEVKKTSEQIVVIDDLGNRKSSICHK